MAVWQDPALTKTFVNNIYLSIPSPFTTLMLSSTVDESMAVWDWESSNVTKSLITPSYLAIFDANFWTGSMRHMTWNRQLIKISGLVICFWKKLIEFLLMIRSKKIY